MGSPPNPQVKVKIIIPNIHCGFGGDVRRTEGVKINDEPREVKIE